MSECLFLILGLASLLLSCDFAHPRRADFLAKKVSKNRNTVKRWQQTKVRCMRVPFKGAGFRFYNDGALFILLLMHFTVLCVRMILLDFLGSGDFHVC